MSVHDSTYLDIVYRVLAGAKFRPDRTGTGAFSIFSHTAMYNLREGFPLLTTKDMTLGFKHIVAEMLWMLEGNTNANYLADKYGFKVWRKWAKNESGELGPVYGYQWRNFDGEIPVGQQKVITGADQISWVMNELATNPMSRRMVVSAWNPNQLSEMALPPCHWAFELYVDGKYLNMKLHQRSCDLFLGVPYNIAEYALLLSMMAKVSGYTPGFFIHDMTNVHIYSNHVSQMQEQLNRYAYQYDAPHLIISGEQETIFDFKPEDFQLEGYQYFDKLTGDVAV